MLTEETYEILRGQSTEELQKLKDRTNCKYELFNAIDEVLKERKDNKKGTVLFKNIRKVLDDFENTNNKLDNDKQLTREDEDAIWYSNLRLAEALLKDWSGAERVATMILTENALIKEMNVKFNNSKLPKEFDV